MFFHYKDKNDTESMINLNVISDIELIGDTICMWLPPRGKTTTPYLEATYKNESVALSEFRKLCEHLANRGLIFYHRDQVQ